MVLTWEELSVEQKEQATQSYRSIRSIEEEILEEEVDISGVVNCDFLPDDKDEYVHVII